MYIMSMTVKATEIAWETNDGETYGYYEPTGAEITITGRVRQSMWTTGTNERTWAVCDENNIQVAVGYEEGLRNAKRAALEALNDHLAAVGEQGLVHP